MRILRVLLAGMAALLAVLVVLFTAAVVLFTGLVAGAGQLFRSKPGPAGPARSRRADDIIDVETTKVPDKPAGP